MWLVDKQCSKVTIQLQTFIEKFINGTSSNICTFWRQSSQDRTQGIINLRKHWLQPG